jgi:hypothetical protein
MTRLAGILIGIIFLICPGILAQSDQSRIITVSGKGEMVADADQVTFSFTIQTRNKDLDAAKDINDQKIEKVKEIFKLYSISSKDVEVSSFTLNPAYDYQGGKVDKVEAFNISRHIRVTLKNIEDYEPLVDALIGAEIYNIGGLAYEISDPSAHHQQARENALRKAREKAEAMAGFYGLKLGKVLSIEELTRTPYHGPIEYGLGGANIQGSNVSAEGEDVFEGRKTIKAHVIVKFELTD